MYDDGVLQMLMPERWDAQKGQWRRPSGLKPLLSGIVHVIFGRPFWTPPNAMSVTEILKNEVNAHSDSGSLYFRVYEYKNADPSKAVKLLHMLYREADAATRESALSRSDILSKYLQNRITTVSEPGYRAALYQALAHQEVIRIMGRSHAPFGAQVIDPPTASPAPTDPPIFRTLVIGAILGGLAGLAIAYARALFSRRRLYAAADAGP
jgi:hypothetical protein